MKRIGIIVLLVAAVAGGAWYFRSGDSDAAEAAGTPAAGGGRGGGRRGGGPSGPLTVDMAATARHEVIEYITVVGNLVGEATVDVVPRIAGRIDSISVQLGDRIARGQPVVKIEDREIQEQINQSEASLRVNLATVNQRENDLKVRETTLGRMRASFEKGLISQAALEDAEAQYNAAVSQVNVAKAQVSQTQARIDEQRIALSNTTVVSPVDGFVSRRALDAGAFAGANTPILSVVDISTVRMVANLVEKDVKRVRPGVPASVEVDAFPGERFTGQVSRVAPVFDPATRTAQMEIEVPNPGYRLKPGMYARVQLTVDRRADALTVPRNAVVDLEGRRGVFLVEEQMARFRPIRTGLEDGERVEVLEGLEDGQRVITVGALALRDGDRVIVAGAASGRGDGQAAGGGGRRGRGAAAGSANPPAGGSQ
jgi:RND family efflux transporter MFP subunit